MRYRYLLTAALLLFAMPATAQELVVPQPYSYRNVTTDATTIVKASQGTLRAVVVNKPGTTATVTLYDNTAASGTKIATLSPTAAGTVVYDVSFAIGLTAVTTGGADLTFVFR